jgi:hypothetical protein
MSKKSWKGNPRYNKKKSVRSIQPAEKIAQTTAVTPQSSTKTTLPTTATKTMPDYKDVYIELKRIGILFVIIVLAIVILWLLLR